MTILDTYDNFTFTLIIVFLFIFLLSFIVLIMFNINNSNNRSNNRSNSSNLGQSSLYNNSSSPTLQCTPRQTLVGNVVQITC